MYAIKAVTVIPIDNKNTNKSVGTLDKAPTPLNTCVTTDTIKARSPITANITAAFANNISIFTPFRRTAMERHYYLLLPSDTPLQYHTRAY